MNSLMHLPADGSSPLSPARAQALLRAAQQGVSLDEALTERRWWSVGSLRAALAIEANKLGAVLSFLAVAEQVFGAETPRRLVERRADLEGACLIEALNAQGGQDRAWTVLRTPP